MCILVLGSGRSGTHWLGHVLDSHPDISATIEDPRFFREVVAMALDARERAARFEPLVEAYRREAEAVRPQRFADKSHPNIWLATELADALPDASFVGIERGVHGTVASMLRHRGVLAWHDRWREFPVPNPFLGITAELSAEYDDLSTIDKCVIRWLSHRERMQRLRSALPGRLHVVQYEDMIARPERETEHLQRFLQLERPFPVPTAAVESLDRWRDELSTRQVDEIDRAVDAFV